jgi:hypothetical protein
MTSRSCSRISRGLLLFTIAAASFPAVADVPVSLGTRGAIERATLTQGESRKGSAASFGTPAYNEQRGFGFRLRIPLYIGGDLANNDDTNGIVPFAAMPSRRVIAPIGLFEGRDMNLFASEDMGSIMSYIPAIQIGDERKAYHFQLGALSSRIGHGSIVHYFTNSPEGSARRFGVLGELNSASLGAQILVGDVTDPRQFVAARVNGRPILWFAAPDSMLHPNDLDMDPRSEIAGMWVTGLTAAADFMAPTSGGGAATAWSVGWDNELALLDNKIVRLIGFVDLNAMGGPRDGAMADVPVGLGAHPGARVVFDIPIVAQIEISGDYNFGTRGYVPRYFDRLYFLERDQMFGSTMTKASAVAPASHGYNLRVGANIMKTVSVFLEGRDQIPFYGDEGTNSAMLTGGASFWFMFFGGGATVSQAGIREYGAPGLMGSGFVLTAEGRVALLANVVHIVGRYYRVHDPVDINLDNRDFNVLQGTLIGLEVNFDLNTPFPLF